MNWLNKTLALAAMTAMSAMVVGCVTPLDPSCPNGATLIINIPAGGQCYNVTATSSSDEVSSRICANFEANVVPDTYQYTVKDDNGTLISSGSKDIACGATETVTVTAVTPESVALTLNVTASNGGSGEVAVNANDGSTHSCSSSAGNCAFAFPKGTTLTLKATPAAITNFSGFSGVTCMSGSATDSCSFVLNSATTASAAFAGLTQLKVKAITSGDLHTCALLTDGTVKCFGFNSNGQLGNGSSVDHSVVPVTVTGLTGITAIAANGNHTCAIASDQSVWCWGENSHGELGDLTYTQRNKPVLTLGVGRVISIAAGRFHNCALRYDRTVYCWGNNSYGQLGDGTTTRQNMATIVPGLTDIWGISAGAGHSCAIQINGDVGGGVKCWGRNSSGELGNGTNTNSLTPVFVSGLTGVESIAGSDTSTCARLYGPTGPIKCWGNNAVGQLGDGTTTNRNTPVSVVGLSSTAKIVSNYSTCALMADSTVNCWGYNIVGQLGNGTRANSSAPVPVSGLTGATAVSMGSGNVLSGGPGCAILTDQTVMCWGENTYGQFGNGTTAASNVPVRAVVGE